MKKRTRFDGTEMTIFERISKLSSGKDSSYSEGVLHKICMNLGTHYAFFFLLQVDELGLYGQRMYNLYEACDYDLTKTAKAVIGLHDLLREGVISQNDVIAVKEAGEFIKLLSAIPNNEQ